MAVNKKSAAPWEQTMLWKRLTALAKKCSASKTVHAQLTLWLPKIDAVLHSGGTQPKDFTLHDDAHALQVAQRMDQIITDTSRDSLSAYELALLLLAAWLHDIGMVPEVARFTAHRDYLLTGSRDSLTPEDHAAFQKYLDDRSDSPRVPFLTGTPTTTELDHADLILAYYVRERHNDWSADWIRQHLPDEPLAGYGDFRADLIRLCDSHHRDQPILAGPDFNSRLHGNPPQPVALRYLACVLRVADILENSPDRVPDVVFRHRDVGGRSILHWEVPHRCSQTIHAGKVSFNGSPKTAAAHKAMLDLAGAIDRELTLCADLRDAQPFGHTPGAPNRSLEWPLERKTAQHIEPAPGSDYEYIDGTFRPDTQALLRLVAGESLYGTPLAAVRELLQNAFDAVREKIALRRLQLTDAENPADPAWEEKLGNEERVTLRLERRNDGHLYLICTDTGTGMTRDIIRDQLLVSGRPPGSRHKDLERRCQAKGFTMGRTARFGIGCLSYFMLADEVTIETRRWQECGDAAENCTWQFRTTGTGEFGELKKLPWKAGDVAGTTVVWRIRKEAALPEEQLEKALGEYLEEKLAHSPCPLILHQALQVPSLPALWCQPVDAEAFHLTAESHHDYPYLLKRTYDREEFEAAWNSIPSRIDRHQLMSPEDREGYDNIRQNIRFDHAEDYESGVARIRLTLAWLQQGNDAAMLWCQPREGHPDNSFDGYEAIEVSRKARESWHGMKSRVEIACFQMRMTRKAHKEWGRQNPDLRNWILQHSLGHFDIDIDLLIAEGAHLTASRDEVTLSKVAADKVKALCHRAMRRLAAKVRAERPGTTLEKQMAELEDHFRKQEAKGAAV